MNPLMTQTLKIQTLLLMISFTFLTGCSTLSAKDCATMDWRERGLKDGREGEDKGQIGNYQKRCREFNISVDAIRYKAGYQSGLKEFCTYDNGMKQGEDGKKNGEVCPDDLAAEFNKGHKAGYKIFELREELEEQKKKQEDELKRQREQSEEIQQRNDEAALKQMNQCTFDSDCEPLRCVSSYESVGSASGHVNRCQ
jgi:hypothetical protein